jgi:AcrR family transcriptional regulator
MSPVTSNRSTKARGRALAAASRILESEGYSRLTMERVAADSGVAKTTIYRRWPSKAALCMDLYLDVSARELRDPDTGDVARDLEQICRSVVRVQTGSVAGTAFRGLLAEAQINPETRGALLDFADRRREISRIVLRRAIQRRQIRLDTDIELVIDAIGGACTFRLLQGHAPLTPKFAAGIVRLALDGCRAPSKEAK